MAPAASAAMLLTLRIAAVRVAAICFSASASLPASFSSSALRSASAEALSFSRVSLQFAFIGIQRRVGLVLQLLRFRQVALDRVLACLDNAADARHRKARHDDVER